MNQAIIINYLIEELKLSPSQIRNTVELLQNDATIPFIARYRKEKTGELDEIQIREIDTRYKYYQTLLERKETILSTIESQGKLTPDLQNQIEQCRDKQILEDLYLPYKPRRKAIEKGLKPLAELIMAQIPIKNERAEILALYVNPNKGVNSAEEALLGAKDILAQQIADTAEYREYIRGFVFKNAVLTSKVAKKFADQKTKFEMYYNFSEKLLASASHRILAIRRGEAEDILKWELAVNDAELIQFLQLNIIKNKAFMFYEELKIAIEEAYHRLMFPSIQTECFNQKCELAEKESIEVFSMNLKNLLLSAPAGQKVIMGIDPGFRTGCKVVIIDQTGRYLTTTTIYPTEPHNKTKEAEVSLLKLIETYQVSLVAIGNGTASRETMEFVKKIIKENALEVIPVIVNESGASIYSASEYGHEEFPDLDVTVRGAISIARRLQDPLAELVKIDPKSIGVGQYQHDVNQAALKEALDFTTEYSVNHVGVDVNTASSALLAHVAGIGKVLGQNIVKFRDQNNIFESRKQLLKVPKLGPKAFEQCAGFLRIKNGKNPLDNSAIHPESYSTIEKMAQDLGCAVKDLVGNQALISKIELKNYVTAEIGLPTLQDIVTELKKPGLDPREEFTYAKFDETIASITDLKENMVLEGVVTNVTNFGAFVDLGVHQDGLIHISKLADRFIKNPAEVISVGECVKVKIIGLDLTLKRIQLQRV